MEHYPYSSYRYYKLNQTPRYYFIDTSILPTLFKIPEQQTNEYLCEFTETTQENGALV